MHWLRNLKSNKTAQHTFILLIVGFILIQIATVFVVDSYSMRHRNSLTRREFQRELVRTVHLLDTLPITYIKKNLKLLTQYGIYKLTFTDGPMPGAAVISSSDGKDLRTFASKHYINFRASYQLKNGQWVTLHGGARPSSLMLAGFILSLLFILLILVMLCVWVVLRLAIPISEFEHASRRFGVDLQAPPLAIQGSQEMRAVIASFNEMQGRIRRLIMDRTQMLAAISHDLRTPITRLQLRIEALKDQEQYQKAEADLNEMERMISSILSFARGYTQSEPMERFDLNALVENICNELEDTGMHVHFEGYDDRLPYFGRMTAIKRALTNLIENAVKYGDRASVSVSADANQLKIKILDQGSGIPESEMEKVFAPFYRVDPARNPEKSGSGLGMAVARDIVRAHGGDVVLHNSDKGGLLVVVTLPLNMP